MSGGSSPPGGATKSLVKGANELRAALLLEITRTGASSQHTLGELFTAVVEHLKALGRQPTTLHGYEGIARRVPDRLRRKTLRKLRASDLDGFYAQMLRAGTSAAPFGATTRSSTGAARSGAVRWEWVGDNVSDRASPPPEPHRRMDVQDAAAVGRLIEAAEQSSLPEMAIAFRILAAMGGRAG